MNILTVIQLISAIVLIVLILLQSRGTGFSRSSGGSTSSFTRRGLEKAVFRLTFIMAGFFVLLSLYQIVS